MHPAVPASVCRASGRTCGARPAAHVPSFPSCVNLVFFFSAAGSLPARGLGPGSSLGGVGEGCQVPPSPAGGVTHELLTNFALKFCCRGRQDTCGLQLPVEGCGGGGGDSPGEPLLGLKYLFNGRFLALTWGPWPQESAVAQRGSPLGRRELCLGWFLSPRGALGPKPHCGLRLGIGLLCKH